jgi:hypothetical protein
MKTLTKEEIIKANEKNPCFVEKCPHCNCDVIDQLINRSKIYNTEAWLSGCPKCHYSFCD